ncbi:transcription factor with AP2 domain [Babesia caballi]|uniref:Transcription factor with AP2 domain n=1 Tax=Babesia caballi TaxID=5871 RepID=A0AAV4LUB3_BABCB|nr:transcription factor with AP2 domain [Babesia caballi]
MSQPVQMEQMQLDATTYGMAYHDPFMGYVTPESYGAFPTNNMVSTQGVCYYDESYGTPKYDFMNATCYQPSAGEQNSAAAAGMFMCMDSTMTPAPEYNTPMMYGMMDMGYCSPGESTYYGVPSLAATQIVSTTKGDFGDDAKSFADCSTAATTPNLEPSMQPEVLDDGFDLGYGYNFSGAAMGLHPASVVEPSGDYYGSYHTGLNVEDFMSNRRDTDLFAHDAIIVEIANEIASNVQFLPDKEASGKYSLDKNHPIHCVWRDLNRGHCSWRCRWWENGKRLSKNFNVKRFGEREAMWMAIAMKIRNSTPVERFQLLKEQREAVRNYSELSKQQAGDASVDPSLVERMATIVPTMEQSPRRKRPCVNNVKAAQKANWARLGWTYIVVPDRRAGGTSVVCRLCAKTTKCSRSRNLQQAHIMHLIRMHKNPWKRYLATDGLTKMCRSALDALYEQQGFTADSEWKLRSGILPPEPQPEHELELEHGFSSIDNFGSDEE